MSRDSGKPSKPKSAPKAKATSKPVHQNGKGDSPRNISSKFRENYDKIFRKK
jgi:hypothetical protein